MFLGDHHGCGSVKPRPCFAPDRALYTGETYAVPPTKCLHGDAARSVLASNGAHHFLCHLRHAVLAATSHTSWMFARSASLATGDALRIQARCVSVSSRRASFIDHIAHVIGMRAQKQVCRIDAQAHIAAMTDVHASRNRPVGQFIRDTVGAGGCAMRVIDADRAVASMIASGSPQPAVARPINVLPEAISNRDFAILTRHADLLCLCATPEGVRAPLRLLSIVTRIIAYRRRKRAFVRGAQ